MVAEVVAPSLASVGLLMVTVKSSLSSSSVSSLKVTVTDFSVSPSAKLRVASAGV